ncbi:hypothetical protein [Bradyrhizobium sp. BWA-3-5]|uniref:hypothetical protein n=1 Tax=Bradyrhizobium sp. BWA-3-5 TaxID=3080013 RepID=UPI00293E78AA|nr:hypothetical protein [Bradyrhizobium sp. BWA-3-5]WOH64325.1 hypothetical protein RX331_27760 [Bradyrhizobium sp. BWA-3-5]
MIASNGFYLRYSRLNLVRLPKLIAESADGRGAGLCEAFAGRWRIVELTSSILLKRPPISLLAASPTVKIAFGAFSTSATARETVRPRAEFSWESRDENAPACGREWVMIATADTSPTTSTYTMATIQARLRRRLSSYSLLDLFGSNCCDFLLTAYFAKTGQRFR